MSAMSDYLEDAFLDHFLGTTSTTAPSAVYIGLHTADPTDAGTSLISLSFICSTSNLLANIDIGNSFSLLLAMEHICNFGGAGPSFFISSKRL